MNGSAAHTNFSLPPSKRLRLLKIMLSGVSPLRDLSGFSIYELIEAQEFVWEKALEVGIRMRKEEFSQKDIVRQIKPTEQHKREAGCNEPLQLCEANGCLHRNPKCLRKKLEDQIDAICRVVAQFLEIEYSSI